MTDILDQAFRAVRDLPVARQQEIVRLILDLAGAPGPVALSPEERDAIAISKAAAERGEFASEEQIRAVWAKHGL